MNSSKTKTKMDDSKIESGLKSNMEENIGEWIRRLYTTLAYDCHMPDTRPEFLSALDPEWTAQTLKEAQVGMLQLCAKSHWGLSLHPTKVGKQHSNLNGRDYFGEVLDAINRQGIQCLAYLSDFWDNYAGCQHPEWRQLSLKESKGEIELIETDWITLCPMSGYRQYFLGQIAEVARNYDIAGIFIDMTGFFGYCYCDNCRKKYREDTGDEIPETQNWQDPRWRQYINWRYLQTEIIMKERRDLIHSIKPEITLVHNYHGNLYHYQILSHNSATAHRYSDFLTSETSPWSAYFGMHGASQIAKFVRDCADGKAYNAIGSRNMTGHDFTEKSDMELGFDTYSSAANNCPYMIIESTDWNGLPIQKDFEAIGKAFSRVNTITNWLVGSEPSRYAGIVMSRQSMDFYVDTDPHRITCEANAVYKTCIEKHMPVGYLFDEYLDEAHLSKFEVVILPDCASLSETQCDALRKYVYDGGGLVSIHQASLFDENGKERENFALSDVFGCSAKGKASNAFTWLGETRKNAAEDLLAGSKILFKEQPCYVPIDANPDTEITAVRIRPPFEYPHGTTHSSHSEMPFEETGEPLAVVNHYGKGVSVYYAVRLGGAYIKYGYNQARELLADAIRTAAQKDPEITTSAPMAVEILLQKQPGCKIIHLLNYANRPSISWTTMDFPSNGLGGMQKSSTIYDEILPVYNIVIEVAVERIPKRVYLVPSMVEQDFSMCGNCVSFMLQKLEDACSICIE